MKKVLIALALGTCVAVISAGCNSEPPITNTPNTSTTGSKIAPELANTPGKNYSNASPEVQQKMAEMARNSAAKR
ncbi:MAG: hypothetical protein QM758_19945 [Armatimonas sp.]